MTRALVLSGGGGLGAYQVGALKFLSTLPNISYDMVYGVSVGGINGAKVAMYPKTELSQSVLDLEKMWRGLDTSDVYKRHFPFGMLHILWNGTHLFDTSPLVQLIHREFDAKKVTEAGNEFGVGAVSWNTGKYRVINHTHEKIKEFIYASSVFPMGFAPIKLEGEWWIDGGVRNAVPLKAALDAGATEVDMILTESEEMAPIEGDPEDVTQYGPRIIGIMANEIFNTDFKDLVKNSDAKVNVYRPASSLAADPLSFEQSQIERLIQIGYDDAQKLGVA